MATLTPFQALRFNPKVVKDMGKVTAPPYDIISAHDQDFYYDLHPNNIIRLDFGKQLAADNETVNKYSRAAKLLQLWREQGILAKDPKPSLYVIAHDYVSPVGKKMTFAGVFSLLKIENYKTGVVKPHEKTLSKPKSDRMDLTRATHTNFSPIFMLFDDKKNAVQKWMATQMKRKPELDFKVPSGERHRLWPVQTPAVIKAFQKNLSKSPLYIADGHHRYETMLAFSKEAPKALKKKAAFTLACLAPFQSKGMTILPTHRIIEGLSGFHPAPLIKKLEKNFEVKEQKDLKAIESAMAKGATAKKNQIVFGLVLGSALPCYTLTLKSTVNPKKAVPGKRSDAYKNLDVAILQALILEDCLGMTPESIAAQENIIFEKSASKAEQMVLNGAAQAAVLVNPTRMDQLKAVSDAKDVMPQKSTYFLPKLLTGTILRSLE